MKAVLVHTEQVDGKNVETVVESASTYTYLSDAASIEAEKARIAVMLWQNFVASSMGSGKYRIIFS